MKDTRHRHYNRRLLVILNKNDEVVGQVLVNIYFPDCLKWDKVKELGYRGYT